MSAFLDDWRAQVRYSITEFTGMWINARDVDLTHGLLPTALLWPIAHRVKEFDIVALEAVREVIGDRTIHVLGPLQQWEMDPLSAARDLAAQSQKDAELQSALVILNTYFDAVPLFADALAHALVAQQGGGNVTYWAEQIRGVFVNIGGKFSIDSLTLNFPQPSQVDALDKQRLLVLLKRVEEIWVKGVLEDSLHHRAMIMLDKQARPEAVERPWDSMLETPSGQQHKLPVSQSILEVFDQAGYALLILGDPGSGKTTMLLDLTRFCLARAKEIPGHPIPVVFNLASWANRRLRLEEWLVEELNNIYQIPKNLGRPWIAQDALMILLDGLDEVRTEQRLACLEAINAFRVQHGVAYIAVCSRIGEYEALVARLRLGAAIVLRPLTSQQIDDYLAAAGRPMDTVRALLEHDPPLQELAQSPVILSVMTLAYANESIEALVNDELTSLEARRRHLFDTYIGKMLTRRRGSDRYNREQILRWLSWLAWQMTRHAQSIFLLEQVQPTWLPNFWQRLLHKLIGLNAMPSSLLGWSFMVGMWLLGTVSFFLWLRSPYGSMDSLLVVLAAIVGLPIAIIAWMFRWAFIVGVMGILSGKVVVLETVRWSWTQVLERWDTMLDRIEEKRVNMGWAGNIVQVILLINVVSMIFSLCLLGPTAILYTFGILGSISCLGIIFGGLAFGQLEKTISPNQGIWRSGRNALLVGVSSGALTGVIVYYLLKSFGTGLDLGSPLIIGITVSFLVGLIGALTTGGWALIYHFLLRLLISKAGYLPWNLTQFLDYAAERIIMQKVGGGYIFYHRLLMEHFASLESPYVKPLLDSVQDWIALIELSSISVEKNKPSSWAHIGGALGGGLIAPFALFAIMRKEFENSCVRTASAFVQFRVANGEAVAGLLQSLSNNPNLTGKVIAAFAQLGGTYSAALDSLLLNLKAEDPLFRAVAALALRQLYKQKPVLPLVKSSLPVIVTALSAAYDNPQNTESPKILIGDKTYRVIDAVNEALQAARKQEEIQSLRSFINCPKCREPNPIDAPFCYNCSTALK